jgi:hypothetical protein
MRGAGAAGEARRATGARVGNNIDNSCKPTGVLIVHTAIDTLLLSLIIIIINLDTVSEIVIIRISISRVLLGHLIIMLNLPYQFIIVNGTGDNVMHYDNDIKIIIIIIIITDLLIDINL